MKAVAIFEWEVDPGDDPALWHETIQAMVDAMAQTGRTSDMPPLSCGLAVKEDAERILAAFHYDDRLQANLDALQRRGIVKG